MEIIPIFVDETNQQGIHSIVMSGSSINEYRKLFNLWYDPEYLLKYCKRYKSEIFGFFGTNNLEDFVENVYKEVELLEDVFLDFKENHLKFNNDILARIFMPLNNTQFQNVSLQLSKAKLVGNIYHRKPVLRVYSIKLAAHSFIVTGGCIKLTKTINETEACKKELSKINMVKDYLKSIGCNSGDDLIYYYEQY